MSYVLVFGVCRCVVFRYGDRGSRLIRPMSFFELILTLVPLVFGALHNIDQTIKNFATDFDGLLLGFIFACGNILIYMNSYIFIWIYKIWIYKYIHIVYQILHKTATVVFWIFTTDPSLINIKNKYQYISCCIKFALMV